MIKVDTIPEIYKSESNKDVRNLYIKRLSNSSVLSVKNNLDNPDSDDDSDSYSQISLSNNVTIQNNQNHNINIKNSPFMLDISRSSLYEIQLEQESSFNCKY